MKCPIDSNTHIQNNGYSSSISSNDNSGQKTDAPLEMSQLTKKRNILAFHWRHKSIQYYYMDGSERRSKSIKSIVGKPSQLFDASPT